MNLPKPAIIDRYLRNANYDQLKDGIAIYNAGVLIKKDIGWQANSGTFFYNGPERVCEVSVVFTSHGVDSSCGCFHDLFEVCEHQVAAILTLANAFEIGIDLLMSGKAHRPHAENRPAKMYPRGGKLYQSSRAMMGRIPGAQEKRLSNTPFELDPWQDLAQVYSQLTQPDGYYSYANEILKISIDLQKHHFRFAIKHQHWSDPENVELQRDQEGWFVICSCSNRVKQLCAHAYALLEIIVNQWGANEMLDYERLIPKIRESVAKEFGISQEEIPQYFDLKFSDGSFIYMPNVKGLIGKAENNEIIKTISGLADLESRHRTYIPAKPTVGIHNKVYALVILSDPDIDTDLRYAVVRGKPNKKGQISTKIKAQYHLDLPPEWAPVKHWFDQLSAMQYYSTAENIYYFDESCDRAASAECLIKAKHFLQSVPLYVSDQHDRISKNTIRPVRLSEHFAALEIDINENDQLYRFTPMLIFGDARIPLLEYDGMQNQQLSEFGDEIYLHPSLGFNDILGYLMIQQEAHDGDIVILKSMQTEYHKLIRRLSEVVHLNFNTREKPIAETLDPQKKQLYLHEEHGHIIFTPKVKYSDQIELPLLHDTGYVQIDGNKIVRGERDKIFERTFISEIINFIPEFEALLPLEMLYLPAAIVSDRTWFLNFIKWVREHEIHLYGEKNLTSIKFSMKAPSLNLGLKSGINWFSTEVDAKFDDEKVSVTQLRRVIQKGEEYIQLGDGKLGIIPEQWRKKLASVFRVGEIVEGEIHVSKLQFNVIDELFNEIDDAAIVAEIEEKKAQFASFSEIKNVELPASITADLRPYQKQGFDWLCFLDEYRFGGCLADDMGLGKTLQVLCMLAKSRERGDGASLVIVPRSLLFNWENEIHKFCPTLTYKLHHGNQRAKTGEEISDVNVAITTYGTAMRDINFLREIEFEYIILDESQAIKNPSSKTYKAVRLLQAHRRIVMTGTPIQNNTFDLYAQMSFANPGLLGGQNQFRDNYVKPIDRDGDEERADELRRMINPFVLRRTKEQVASDLPPKTEQVLMCEMPPDQRKVYELYRKKYANELGKLIEAQGLNKSKIYVIEGLTRLRQICNAPVLVSSDYADVSAEKLDVLTQQLISIISAHKVLVFSQFVETLKLIKPRLENAGIFYHYLDGKTTNRKKVIDAFQNDEENCAFLISLKAGGTGLNLTAADYVFIVDPWWNPAAEQQAIDRTHRIGQDKPVMAYKLICKNTIEEKILELQSKKKKIASDIIHTEESVFKSLSQADIADLFMT